MLGFFELQLPAALRDRLETPAAAVKGGSLLGAGILGALSGLLVGLCMTARWQAPCCTLRRAAMRLKVAWCCL